MMLNDSNIFSGSAELTTKEILKRYKDNERAPTSNRIGQSPLQGPDSFSRGGRQNAPPIQRIDTDPNVWHNESSVRHVGGPGPGGLTYGPSNNATPTSQHHPYDLPGGMPHAPYAQGGTGSSESINGGSPNRSSMRGSGAIQKQPGALGITG